MIVSEKISRELALASRELEIAEASGDEAVVERLMEQCSMLTTRIAQLHKAV